MSDETRRPDEASERQIDDLPEESLTTGSAEQVRGGLRSRSIRFGGVDGESTEDKHKEEI